jgi:hypothetical protein
VPLNEPSGQSSESESRELSKIEGEDKYALMTPSQIGVARLDAARVVVLEKRKEPKNELTRIVEAERTEG